MRERDEAEQKDGDLERSLRFASDHLSLWRVCANASCRRARCCRGRAATCADRNAAVLPKGVRDWFAAFLSAKLADVPFDEFREEMEFSEELAAYRAWKRLAESKTRGSLP
jgi:hypothetical protein